LNLGSPRSDWCTGGRWIALNANQTESDCEQRICLRVCIVGANTAPGSNPQKNEYRVKKENTLNPCNENTPALVHRWFVSCSGALHPAVAVVPVSKLLSSVSSFRLKPMSPILSLVPGFRVQGSGYMVQGPGSRVQGSGFRVQGSEYTVQGPGSKVQGPRFRVQGS
jgi:hypothetical protein